MHPAEQWLWRWMARPVSALAAGTLMTALLAGLACGPPLYARWQELENLRRDNALANNSLGQHRRTLAALPPAPALEQRIARLSRGQAASDARQPDPGAFISAIGPGRAGKLRWQAPSPAKERARIPRRWTAEVSTDYPGLLRILRRLAELPGNLSLDFFEATARDAGLDVRFELSETRIETPTDEK